MQPAWGRRVALGAASVCRSPKRMGSALRELHPQPPDGQRRERILVRCVGPSGVAIHMAHALDAVASASDYKRHRSRATPVALCGVRLQDIARRDEVLREATSESVVFASLVAHARAAESCWRGRRRRAKVQRRSGHPCQSALLAKVCVQVCLCAFVHVCLYLHSCAVAHACACEQMFICSFAHMCICKCACVQMCTCLCECVCGCPSP